MVGMAGGAARRTLPSITMSHSLLTLPRLRLPRARLGLALLLSAAALPWSAAQAQTIYAGYPTDLGDSTRYLGQNMLIGERITVTTPMTLSSAGAIFYSSNHAVEYGLYTNNAGLPDQLIASTDIALFPSGQWGTQTVPFVNFTGSTLLQPGTYWLMGTYTTDTWIQSDGTLANTLAGYISWNANTPLPASFTAYTLTTHTGPTFNYFLTGTSPVPEPATWTALAGLAALGAVILRRRQGGF
jgi:hypothetical protein